MEAQTVMLLRVCCPTQNMKFLCWQFLMMKVKVKLLLFLELHVRETLDCNF